MEKKPLVSLCMPTNGVIDWVFPVLESIYSQDVDNDLFEVVITDNGDNAAFKETIRTFADSHANLCYYETDALPFINEIEAYKRANGELIKYVNHRTKLVNGTLDKLINISEKYISEKPIIYFANGNLKKEHKIYKYDSFDDFVRNLSFYSTWSTGMTIWKEDFEKLPKDVSSFNELYPHTNVLFNERHRGKYFISNEVIFDEIPQGKKPKGNYDYFYAFGVDYLSIILDLYRDGDITIKTFQVVVDENLDFLADSYINYCILHQYCSYDLSGFKDMLGVYYTKKRFFRRVLRRFYMRCGNKIVRR